MKLTQLKKIAKSNLIPLLDQKGFRLVNTLSFVREGSEGIFHAIYPDISYGENLKVYVGCHTREMDQLLSKEFPKLVAHMVGGFLEPGEPISYESGHIWKVETNAQAEVAMEQIQKAILESALPFFDSIADRKALVGFIYPSMKTDKYEKIIGEILSWKSASSGKFGS